MRSRILIHFDMLKRQVMWQRFRWLVESVTLIHNRISQRKSYHVIEGQFDPLSSCSKSIWKDFVLSCWIKVTTIKTEVDQIDSCEHIRNGSKWKFRLYLNCTKVTHPNILKIDQIDFSSHKVNQDDHLISDQNDSVMWKAITWLSSSTYPSGSKYSAIVTV